MSNGLHRSNIDYIAQSGKLIGREGYVLNIITGCRHTCPWCYARGLVEHGRLKGTPSYPYGFEPTFHPERIVKIGGKPKLIFLNDMGDVGGDWTWKNGYSRGEHAIEENNKVDCYEDYIDPQAIANMMVLFAELNPQHILLLLTKRPEWYGLAEWPENVWCGFTATNNEEYGERFYQMKHTGVKRNQMWVSLEPWLDSECPGGRISAINDYFDWLAIGGLSGKHPRKLNDQSVAWVQSYQGCLFIKSNTGLFNYRQRYPESWRIK